MNILLNYIDKGGVIVLILIGFNIIGFSVIIWKFIQLRLFSKKLPEITAAIHKDIVKNTTLGQNTIAIITAETNSTILYLDKGLNIIQTIATISPLIGLLGTVLGVLFSFEEISKFGLSNPAIFSSGISVALITTIAGLIVAIPHYVAYNYLVKVIDAKEIILYKNLVQQSK